MRLDDFVLKVLIVVVGLLVLAYVAGILAGGILLFPWGLVLLIPLGIVIYVVGSVIRERVKEAAEDPYDSIEH
ncbi:MAG: hypothetical protein AAFQ51_16275 [Pseudomonadota bacterium]